jgi:hypothetical protein
MPDTIDKLMKDVSAKCWFKYGVEVCENIDCTICDMNSEIV